jgi:hypothetical protein
MKNKRRNLVLDIMRGHFLLSILVDHLSYYTGNSLFTFYNGNGGLWVSAAEGFVFLAGYFTCLVYLPLFKQEKYGLAIKRLYFRVVSFYIWTVGLTLFYTAFGLYMGSSPYIGEGLIFTTIKDLFIDSFTLHYIYGWADILTLYLYFFLFAPLVLWLFKKQLHILVLIPSFILWALSFTSTSCNRFCVSIFDVYSWQFIFVLGMFTFYYRGFIFNLYRRAQQYLLIKLSIIGSFLGTVYLSVLDRFYNYFPESFDSVFAWVFDKNTLGIGVLLLFFLWITVLYYFIEKNLKHILKYFGWLYLTFGRNSLITYITQSFVLFVFFYLPFSYSFWITSFYYVITILITAILVKMIKSSWLKALF